MPNVVRSGRLTAATLEVAWLVVDVHVATAARPEATSWDRQPRPPGAQRRGSDVSKDRVHPNWHLGAVLQYQSLFVLNKIKRMRLEAGFCEWLARGTKSIGVWGCNSVRARSQRGGPHPKERRVEGRYSLDLQPPPWLKRTCKAQPSEIKARTCRVQ
jgi:hypothetical protein